MSCANRLRVVCRAATLLLFALLALPASAGVAPAAAYPGTLTVTVDLRDAPRRIFHVRETIPVVPGALTLRYPKWIPGEHAPSGPIESVTGLEIHANGKRLAWRRDRVDLYSLTLEVPPGAQELVLEFEFLSPGNGGAFGGGVSATADLALLEFNQFAFYPAGVATDRIQVEPRVTLPAGWQFASALKIASRQGNELRFQSVSFTTLVDSPLIAGRHFKRIDLDPGARVPVFLNVVADRADNLAIDQRQIAQHRALIQQALALFGRAPFAHYDFLLSLSDRTGHFGLEHLQSSDDRLMADFFTDSDSYLRLASLLPHELVHAWNGKYRRPVGLATPDFATPMQTDLLWVYEGLTEYWAGVLSVRAGLWSADDYRQALAEVAQQVHYRRGRQWRSLQDTADAAPLQSYVGGWHNWRRTADYYPEGELLWLEIDARIRALSHNRRSLDDFARRFFAPDHTGATLRRYDFNDVVAALHAVQPADWAAFLRQRLDYTGNEAPVHGLERSGWQLQYAAAPTAYSDASSALMGGAQNLTASLGLFVSGDGRVLDVIWGGPAFKAGLVPGMQLVAVNGSDYSASALQDAIRAAHGKAPPLSLLVKYDTLYSRLSIDYHDGLRYPRLERRRGQPDYLSAILAPRHGAPSTSAKEHTP